MTTATKFTEQLYSPTQAAKVLGLSPRLIRQLCDRGAIEYCQPYGVKRFVTLSEVHRWIRTRTVPRRDTDEEAEGTAERMVEATVGGGRTAVPQSPEAGHLQRQ